MHSVLLGNSQCNLQYIYIYMNYYKNIHEDLFNLLNFLVERIFNEESKF